MQSDHMTSVAFHQGRDSAASCSSVLTMSSSRLADLTNVGAALPADDAGASTSMGRNSISKPSKTPVRLHKPGAAKGKTFMTPETMARPKTPPPTNWKKYKCENITMGAREIKLLGILSRKKTAGAATALLGTTRGGIGADPKGAGATSKPPGIGAASTARVVAKVPTRYPQASEEETGAALAEGDACGSAASGPSPPEADEELSIPCVSRMSTGEGFLSPLGNTRRLRCCGSGGSASRADGVAQNLTPPDTLQKPGADATGASAKPRATPPPLELIAAAAAAVHGTKSDCKSDCYDTDGDCDDHGIGDVRHSESPRSSAGKRQTEPESESKAEAKEDDNRGSQELGTPRRVASK